MTGWMIAAGVLGLLALLLLGRASLIVRYDGDLSVVFQYYFLRYTIYPKKENKPKKQDKKGKAKKEQSREKKQNPFQKLVGEKGFVEAVGEVCRLVKTVLTRFHRLLLHAEADPFYLDLTVAGEDAAATAIAYGGVCAAIYPLLGAAWSIVKVGRFRADIQPDFDDGPSQARLHVRLRLRPLYALHFLCGIIKDYVKGKSAPAEDNRKSSKEGAGK